MTFLENIFVIAFLANRVFACYDDSGQRAVKCVAPFMNIAYEQSVEASNTCGQDGPSEYYGSLFSDSISTCDANSQRLSHGAEFLTDDGWKRTWWQSDTMEDGVQSVNLTLNFGKEYQITYIRLKFHSPRPDSFAIYKRTTPSSPWTPYQFYSSSCESTYNVPKGNPQSEDQAACTDEFSDISPLTGGSVSFSTLSMRPGAFHYDTNSVLQEWTTASSIRISLTRLNTFGDEEIGGPRVRKSYFYAITDLSVGGRCKCNGHASSCSVHSDGQMACDCEHNTTGINCERCKRGYNNYGSEGCTSDGDPTA